MSGHWTTSTLPRWFIAVVAVAPLMLIGVFYLWPFATVLARAGRGLDIDRLVTTSTIDTIVFTTAQAIASTVLTVIIGLPLAGVVARYRFVGRRLVMALVTAAFVLPTVVVGTAFVALLPVSLERSIGAILAAHVMFNLAVVMRIVGTSWQQFDPRLEAAAATLGAGPLRTFTTITWPLIRPSVIGAASIVFVFCFTSFGVIRILGGPGRSTIEVEIWRRATQLGDIATAAVLSVAQLVVLIGVIAWSARRQRRLGIALDLVPGRPGRRPRRASERLLVGGVAIVAVLIVAAPLIAMVERSLRPGDAYSLAAWRDLGRTEIRPGIRLGIDPWASVMTSLQIAVVATVLAVVIGALAALAIDALGRRGALLDAGIMLPLGTSAVTIGFGMLITFARPPVEWRAAWWLVPVGHALVAVPFVVRTTLVVLRNIDPRLRAAAATLGAGPIRAWRAVVVPMLGRPLAVSAALAGAISLGEFGATSFLSRSGRETVPIVIERLVSRTGPVLQAQAFAVATILAAMTIAVVIVIDLLGTPPERTTAHPSTDLWTIHR